MSVLRRVPRGAHARRAARRTWGTGSPVLTAGTGQLRAVATVCALTLVGSVAAMFVPLTVANATVNGGYAIDGSVPDAGTLGFTDPSGEAQELGALNGSTQQLGVIHKARKPMLGYTNPTDKADVKNVWLDTRVDGQDVWLYFAWERESDNGSGSILYEFQQAPKPAACDYGKVSEDTLVQTCNPWENRQAGDFIIEFDQNGSTITISRRTFSGTGTNLSLGSPVTLDTTVAAAAVGAGGLRGEAALNLSDTVFAGSSDSCVTLANVIAGTITGNNDTADYKDAVLADTSGTGISNCGSVQVSKQTTPAGETGSFPVSLTRAGGGDVRHPSGTSAGTTLTGDDDVRTVGNLRAGTDYRLAETVPAGWERLSVVCGGVDVTAPAATFTVTAGQTTQCVVTNKKHVPALTLDKTAAPTSFATVGAQIGYSYLVANSGNVDLSGPITVTDDKTTVTCPALPVGDPVFSVGEQLTCTASYTTTQVDLDAGSVVNTAGAHAYFGAAQVHSPTDSATVHATQDKALTLDKTSPTASYDAVGDVVSYSYLVKNTGNVTLAGPVAVTDDKASVSCPAGGLAPLAETTCSATHTITQAELDAGSLTNVARAFAGGAQYAQDSVTVNAVQTRALLLDKSSTATSFDAVGDELSYSYLVTNTGNVTLAGPVTVADDKATVSCPAGSLAPGTIRTCTATHVVAQADLDLGSVTNRATATANTVVSNPDTVKVDGVQEPELTIEKSAAPATYDAVGEVVRYSFLVTNSGTVTLDGPVTVDDDKTFDESCPAVVTLAPGGTVTCTASLTTTQGHLDAGSITNTATASAAFQGAAVTSAPDTARVDAVQSRALGLVKTAKPLTYDAVGDVVSYDYRLTNDGNVTLTGVFTVSDDKVRTSCPTALVSLAPDGVLTCTASHTITQADLDAGSITNTATASGGGVTSAPDDATVTAVQDPELSLTKTPTPTTYGTAGQQIDYVYVVRNSGNTTLAGPFTVADDKTTATCPATAALAPGDTLTCTASYVVTAADVSAGSVTNMATASGGGVTSPPVRATVTAVRVPPPPPGPSPVSRLALVKTASPTTYATVGQQVGYTYLLTNTGETTLTGPFSVADDKTTVSCPATSSLAPTASLTCTASYAVTQADLDAGSVTNLATATNGTVTSNDDSEVVTAVQTRALVVTKAATPTTYASVGDVIGYTYVMTNSGNVTLRGPFTVADDKTPTTCPSAASLAPGATLICTASYAVTRADLDAGQVTNVARATNGITTSPPVQVTVTEEPVEVLPVVVTPPAAPPAPTAPAPAAPAPATSTPPQVLPFTGAWLLPMLAIGSTATMLGALLVGAGRARRASA